MSAEAAAAAQSRRGFVEWADLDLLMLKALRCCGVQGHCGNAVMRFAGQSSSKLSVLHVSVLSSATFGKHEAKASSSVAMLISMLIWYGQAAGMVT
jgi:hypothetical protein